MRNINSKYFTLIGYLLLFSLVASLKLSAQTAPVKQWDKRFGGNGEDYLHSSLKTNDGGLILGGYSASDISGEKSQPMAGYDYWIVKTDGSGNKLWDKTFATNSWDNLVTVKQTADGGYIIGGHSSAGVEGDKSEASRGGYDYWIVKTDAFGNKLWDKSFGGSGGDYLGDLQQTTDGGYILGGYSTSPADGDKSETSRGSTDYWIVKIDASGNKLWDKRFGGNSDDELNSIQQTSDGGYILGGSSYSGIGGDKSQASRGDLDYWIVKTDASGNKLWDKRFGTVAYYGAYFHSLQQTNDGGYILGGFTTAGIVGDKSVPSIGGYDYWIVKTDATGNKIWDKGFGGSGSDALRSLQLTSDGGYLLGGNSDSGIGGDKSEGSKGGSDFWVVKTNANGDKLWDKTYGGSGNEIGCTLQPAGNGAFFIGGYSTSGISGDRSESSRGGNDYWGVKFNFSTPSIVALSADQVTGQTGTQVVVPIRVSDFTNILTAQGTITFEPSVVTFANAEQFAFSDINSNSFGTAQLSSGKITFSWDDDDQTGESLTNNSVLFALRFNVVGASGSVSPISFTSNPTILEFTTPAFATVPHQVTAGEVRVLNVNSIGTSSITPTNMCKGSTVNVSFTATGTFNAGNVFTAQLSDANGSFASPTIIGSVTGTASGSIGATIPMGATIGTGYRIRVVSSNPATNGTDNGTDLSIQPAVDYYLDSDGDGYFSTVATNLCYAPLSPYQLTSGTDCNDAVYAINPGATEVCDGIDNNCDGILDVVAAVDAVYITPAGSNPPTANISRSICQGSSLVMNASVQDAQSGTGLYSYNYQWYLNGNPVSGQTGTSFTATAAGTYSVQVRKYCNAYPASGITSNSNEITITITAGPTVTAASDGIVCPGGTLHLFAYGPAGATYSWIGPNNFMSSVQNPVITNVGSTDGGNYIVTATLNGCTGFASTNVWVTAPIGNNTISGNQSICAGESPTIITGSTPTGGDMNYQYYWEQSTASAFTGFTTISPVMAASYTPSALQQTTWFRRNVRTTGGCHSVSDPVQITVSNPITNNTIGSDQSITAGQTPAMLSGSFPLGGSGGYTYQWEISTISNSSGFAIISGANSINYSPGSLSQNTWFRRVVTSGNCSIISNIVSIQVSIGLSTGIIAPSSLCAGATVNVPFTVTGSFAGGNTFTAQLSDVSGSFASLTVIGTLSGTGSGTITATIPASVISGNGYRIRVISSNPAVTGTSNGSDLSITTPQATITPTGPTTFCSGGSVVLNANTGTGYTYQWKQNGSTIAGTQSAAYTALSSGIYTVVVTQNGCSVTSAPVTVTINQAPFAMVFPAGSTTICQGGQVMLFAPTGTGYTYVWYLDGNPITGATASSYAATAGGSYTVEITANGCSALSAPVAITVAPGPAVTAQASASSITLGGSVTLSVANFNASYTYTWSGVGLSSTTGSPVSATPSSAGTFTYTLTASDGTCTASSQVTIQVLAASLATGMISPGNLCAGATVNVPFTVSGTINNGNVFTAQLSDAAGSFASVTPIGTLTGTTSGTISATIPSTGITSGSGYRIRVVASNPSVTGTDNGTNLTITAPIASITPTGPTTVCSGTNVVLEASTGTGYSYLWKLNGNTIAGATSAVYTAMSTGNYTVVVTENGCSVTSVPVSVSINAAPFAMAFPAGPTTFCQGGQVALFAPTGTGYSYVWNLNGNPITGATASSYVATTAGSYTVTITANGCSAVSGAVPVTVTPGPAVTAQASASTITSGNSTTLSVTNFNAGYTYTWSGVGLSATNGSPVIATPSAVGTYTYSVSAFDGACTATSQVTVTVLPAPVPGDPGVVALLNPLERACLGNSEPILVQVRNFGSSTLTTIPVEVQISGQLATTLTAIYNGSLAPNVTVDINMGSVDLSQAGSYTFVARTTLASDFDATNDIFTTNRTNEAILALPLNPVTFAGFTGVNLNTLSSGWQEGAGTGFPTGLTSDWGIANVNQATHFNGETATIRFDGTTKRHWLTGPKLIPTIHTRLYFEAALTDASGVAATVMGADDKLAVMVSVDCGQTYTQLYEINAGAALSNSLNMFTVMLSQFAGQEIKVAFMAYEGSAIRPGDFDLHLDNILIGDPEIYGAVKEQCLTTQPVLANANNEWRELVHDNQVVGAINDNGVNLGTVAIDFHLTDAANGLRTDFTGKPLLGRYFKMNATNSTFTGNQVGLRLYILDSEIAELVNTAGSGITSVNDLAITQYSGSNENCLNGDNNVVTASVTEYPADQISKIRYLNGYIIELDVLDHFSEFYFKAGSNNSLPVDMVYFNAVRKGKDAELTWATALEENSAGFEVEVSEDAKEFKKLSFVKAKGSNSHYVYLDTEANKNGTRYYRLKQIDLDGSFTYSGLREVTFGEKQFVINAWPNPFSDKLNVALTAAKDQQAEIRMSDVLGRIIFSKQVKLTKGNQKLELELPNKVAKGIYLLELHIDQQRQILKVVKE